MAQSNPQDFKWSLIEHPQSTAMVKPEDPHWISFRQPVRIVVAGTFSEGLTLSVTGTGTNVLVNTAILANAGTDRLAMDVSLGNIGAYDIFNFISPQAVSVAAFGTYFFAVVPAADGTNFGTLAFDVFGSHTAVSVIYDAGTSTGTLGFAVFGLAELVVFTADTGTYPGTFTIEAYGTYTPVTVHAGTHFAFGTLGYSAFGSYDAS